MKSYYVYILATKRGGVLYIGITNDIARRAYEHRQEMIAGFTKRYRVHRLVYVKTFGDVTEALAREKQLKGWNRAWKIRLIEKANPEWNDLYLTLNA